VSEVSEALVGREEGADVAESCDDGIEGGGADPAEVRFELGEGHLDGVEVRRVGREWHEPAALRLEDLGGLRAAVDGKVVQDNRCSRRKDRSELGFDPGVEGGTVHCPGDDPRSDEAIAGQPGDEGLCVPAAERGLTGQALVPRGATAEPGQPGPDRGFIDKDQPLRVNRAGFAGGSNF